MDCVPLAVMAKESFPLAVINRFFAIIIRSGLDREEFTRKSFLSDYHSVHDVDLENRPIECGSASKPLGRSMPGHVVVVEPYDGRRTIPTDCQGGHVSNESEDHQLTRQESEGSSFSIVAAQDVTSISRQAKDDFWETLPRIRLYSILFVSEDQSCLEFLCKAELCNTGSHFAQKSFRGFIHQSW
jgi:hypothetical protein